MVRVMVSPPPRALMPPLLVSGLDWVMVSRPVLVRVMSLLV
jgi:hypothetical protein